MNKTFAHGVVLLSALGSFGQAVRADAPPGHYTVDKNGTVRDNQTQLTWQQHVSSNGSACGGDAPCMLLASTCGADMLCTQAEGVSYCDGLVLGGSDQWRLPTIRELLSIVDVTRARPALDRTAFPGEPSNYFWTSSTIKTVSTHRWLVNLGDGDTDRDLPEGQHQVRCVRGG